MRGQALSTTRKLNRHWQSGELGEPAWPAFFCEGDIGGERYRFATMYRPPAISGLSYLMGDIQGYADPYNKCYALRLDTAAFTDNWQYEYTDSRGIVQAGQGTMDHLQDIELIPSFGGSILEDADGFTLFSYDSDGTIQPAIRAQGGTFKLLCPVYDAYILKTGQHFGATWDEDKYKAAILRIIGGTPSFSGVLVPTGFVPHWCTKQPPDAWKYARERPHPFGGAPAGAMGGVLDIKTYRGAIGDTEYWDELSSVRGLQMRPWEKSTYGVGDRRPMGEIAGSAWHSGDIIRVLPDEDTEEIYVQPFLNGLAPYRYYGTYRTDGQWPTPDPAVVRHYAYRGTAQFYSDSRVIRLVSGAGYDSGWYMDGGIGPLQIADYVELMDYTTRAVYWMGFFAVLKELRAREVVIHG